MKSGDEVTGPINLGNPQEFSIAGLAAKIIDLTGSKSRLVHRPRPQDDPRQRRPDISAAKEDLGWAPRMALVEGLQKTIAYFEDLLKEPGVRDMFTAERAGSA